jgi:membrane protease YdiL (CAAX protease family)
MKMTTSGYFFLAFLLFFFFYHAAEYFVVFTYQPILFFGCQIAFLLAAFLLGKRKYPNGFKTWGLYGGNNLGIELGIGAILGFLLYFTPFVICLSLGLERIQSLPSFTEFFQLGGIMFFGLFFSSLSEDILTRGVIFARFRNRLNPIFLVFLSSIVYYLNHIYRYFDGFETFLYLFLLGVILYLVILLTNRLWMTVMIHWVGNSTFYATHQLIQVYPVSTSFGFNQMLIATELVFIFVLSLIYYFKSQNGEEIVDESFLEQELN